MKVELQGVTKEFESVVAVNNLTLTIESGALVALLGPSGCGKSTTLNMISGILPVSKGRILFDDKDVTALPPEERNIGLVFQNYALYPHMTVLENICFPLIFKKIKKKERIERARELAKLTQIDTLLDRKPAQLSGGQQQRVAIARALVKNPDVLLLDEPLSNLDAKLRLEMREEIKRIQRKTGITTIFVTHDQEEASSIADNVVLMKSGDIQQLGKPREIYKNPSNRFVAEFIGTPSINSIVGTLDGNCFVPDNCDCKLYLPQSISGEPKRVVFAVRPENILVGAETDNCLEVTMSERLMVGKDELGIMKFGNTLIRGYIPNDAILPDAGSAQPFKIGFCDAGVFVFDEATGERYI